MRFLLIFCFVFSSAFSQKNTTLDTLDHKHRKASKEFFVNKLDRFGDELNGKYSNKVNDELQKNIEDFKTFFSKSIDRGEYVYNTPFNGKVEEIYTEIYQKNPTVPKDFQLLVSRNISLNAFCLANGTMVVNTGAIHYLENESQLAAIICHEIAHKLLDHSENGIVKSAIEKHSKESKKETRDIKRQKFNRQERAFSIVKEKLFNHSKENRKHEFEADSVGFLLLRKTKYKPSEFLRALDLSLQYDTIKPANLDIGIYKEIFDIPDQPFQEKWLEKEDFTKYDYVYEEKISSDSISTHPEIVQRIEKLKTDFHELRDVAVDTLKLTANGEYAELRARAKKDQVAHLFALKKYGFCIYLSLYRIQQSFEVEYHKDWLGKAFKEMHKARKAYMANKYLDRINPEEQSESYQQFINFMWNLRLDEIHTIAEYYTR
ncbi:M48 family metallopeptidase [Allomuricauda sp. SCSIO 65647]|uniref:M48 family metallopeptidase n=1 Tax=Allomuricauda sp. SCSIO 65647 TaxID=2908843 RepID=UPI001F2859C2|nr:M48 family metallopeptidase [Muricauda sp. SCSIO 65647]UJH67679.1 M48 family metallopeptidase [Muricauda sp. SCSIO 65647]